MKHISILNNKNSINNIITNTMTGAANEFLVTRGTSSLIANYCIQKYKNLCSHRKMFNNYYKIDIKKKTKNKIIF